MHVFACESVRAWLADVTEGVNAKLASIPRIGAHTVPPNIAAIATPYSDDRCARWEAPGAYPALYIWPDGPVPVEAEISTHIRDGLACALAIRYLVHKVTSRVSAADASYTMEAVHASLAGYLADDAAGRAARTLAPGGVNKKMVLYADSAAYGPWAEEVGDANAIAVFALTLYLRNFDPAP